MRKGRKREGWEGKRECAGAGQESEEGKEGTAKGEKQGKKVRRVFEPGTVGSAHRYEVGGLGCDHV